MSTSMVCTMGWLMTSCTTLRPCDGKFCVNLARDGTQLSGSNTHRDVIVKELLDVINI